MHVMVTDLVDDLNATRQEGIAHNGTMSNVELVEHQNMDTTEGQVTSSMVEIMKEPICVKATVDSTHVIHVMENSDSVDGSGHACAMNQLPSEVVLNPKQGKWQRKQPHQQGCTMDG